MRKLEIEKGNHRTNEPLFFSGLQIGRSRELSYRFRFSKSMYDNPDILGGNGHDISKLFGMSLSLVPIFTNKFPFYKPPHQRKSVRFGYRCTEDEETFELLTYCYDKSERMQFKRVGFFKCGETIKLSIKLYKSKARFVFTNETKKESNSVNEYMSVKPLIPQLYYYLGYYHGGNEPKPSEGTFYAERLTS